jgi:hypothetical protein
MNRTRGFTLKWAGLRITAEQGASRWKALVFDATTNEPIYESEESGPDEAKRVAVEFAVLHLFKSTDGFRPELLSGMLPWESSE